VTRAQALKAAKKRWGKRALVRANDALSSPERRDEARTRTIALRSRRTAIEAEIAERLAALDWYQALRAEQRAVAAELDRVNVRQSYYKFAVGRASLGGFVFSIEGEGDTWEDAFAKADARVKGTDQHGASNTAPVPLMEHSTNE
jgi:hypothetical protein